MDKRLKGRVVIVTGAGRGIGEAIAILFASEGAQVIVATRTRSHGESTVAKIKEAGGHATLHQLDVGVRTEVENLINMTISEYGTLNIVVHNAGYYPIYNIDDLPDDELEKTLAVNLKACFYLTKEAVVHMKKQGGGRLLFTSSVSGPRVGTPGLGHYAASKAGINGFVRTAALEYALDKITVNAIEPGLILTPAMDALGSKEEQAEMKKYIPMGDFGEPEDIAHTMLFLASSEAKYITGQSFVVDGGSTLVENGAFMQ